MNGAPHRLTQYGLINSYLVEEDDGYTLIDAGLPGLERSVQRTLQRTGKPLQRIALTHGHDDHFGALDALKTAHPRLEVLVGTGDTSLLAERGCGTRPTQNLQDGDRVGSLVVIATPGHSPGHVAYFDERIGALYAGDTFVNVPALRVASELSVVFPLPTLGTHDPVQTVRSARLLLDVPARSLAAGHGPVLVNPLPAMRRAVEAAERSNPRSRVSRVVAEAVARLTSAATSAGTSLQQKALQKH
ncbi:MBL fold metallo-hydrolase [Deinococcus deserti]|uniref:Putative Metallo-beta-lactamase superfamily protein n=1 Tax=Deinococcus deserti (strain DSM 17065 / CIP 109153 / LMG 22923 / VCD115) TaxID=546414 RepID=C1CVB3_DEIDV|nr:MBL fold metallo-hydrolase [Deinococcus deserti]ACO46130.1 putative Metallo-beta-lactamase superfamily protein [Deinococcus deserti VCD115]